MFAIKELDKNIRYFFQHFAYQNHNIAPLFIFHFANKNQKNGGRLPFSKTLGPLPFANELWSSSNLGPTIQLYCYLVNFHWKNVENKINRVGRCWLCVGCSFLFGSMELSYFRKKYICMQVLCPQTESTVLSSPVGVTKIKQG